MFKTGIVPMWEDKMNANGSEFRIELKGSNPDIIQAVWEKLVFDIVTGVIPHLKEIVAGIRLV